MRVGVNWRERAANIRWPQSSFIGGRYIGSEASEEAFDTFNPATGAVLRSVPAASVAQVDEAVRSARSAFRDTWRRESPHARNRILQRVCDAVEARAPEFALLDCLEMGKPICQAMDDVAASVRFLRYYAEAADKVCGEVAPTDPVRGITFTLREPWGVVGAIVPWNFPLAAACVAMGPALAAGNAVVLKPSEISPSSVLHFAAIAVEAGLPPGVLNVITGPGATTGAALASHLDVDKLHFTGSTATGRRILELAGRSNGKATMLEMGGKSPQIVFRDAMQVPGLANALTAAAFFNTGQVCVARSRLLVEATIAEELMERLRQASRRYEPGDPLDAQTRFGPLASRSQLEKVDGFLDAARREKLRMDVCGPTPKASGYFAVPCIVSGADRKARIVQEEVFGPVLVVMPFEGVDEAIQLANDTGFGLAATAWTTDLSRTTRLARELDAGRIEIRTSCAPSAPLELFAAEPFRGSGHGVLGGLRGLDAYLRYKAVELITG